MKKGKRRGLRKREALKIETYRQAFKVAIRHGRKYGVAGDRAEDIASDAYLVQARGALKRLTAKDPKALARRVAFGGVADGLRRLMTERGGFEAGEVFDNEFGCCHSAGLVAKSSNGINSAAFRDIEANFGICERSATILEGVSDYSTFSCARDGYVNRCVEAAVECATVRCDCRSGYSAGWYVFGERDELELLGAVEYCQMTTDNNNLTYLNIGESMEFSTI